jgi:L-threonylcarbamoyladenylate synthase
MALSLLQHVPHPLAAPSANPFQSVSPTTAQHVYHFFSDELNIILDGGPCIQGIESTIIGYNNGRPTLFRHGAVPIEAIEKITGPLQVNTHEDTQPLAPGMLGKHYSPRTRLLLTHNINTALLEHIHQKIGLLTFQKRTIDVKVAYQRALSIQENLEEAASQLYAALHELDALGLDLIIAEFFPDEGIGRSINDRLKRAATLT